MVTLMSGAFAPPFRPFAAGAGVLVGGGLFTTDLLTTDLLMTVGGVPGAEGEVPLGAGPLVPPFVFPVYPGGTGAPAPGFPIKTNGGGVALLKCFTVTQPFGPRKYRVAPMNEGRENGAEPAIGGTGLTPGTSWSAPVGSTK